MSEIERSPQDMPDVAKEAYASSLFGDIASQLLEERQRRQDADLRNKKLEHEATHDSLTGLLNRRGLLQQAEIIEAEARRTGIPVAVIFCDLDKFKPVNDTLGHPEGDRQLISVSQRLSGELRKTDAPAILGRAGGDEFWVFAPLNPHKATNLTPEQRARALSSRLQRTVEEHARSDPRLERLGFGASFGYVIFDPTLLDTSLLGTVKEADQAMYQAKPTGTPDESR